MIAITLPDGSVLRDSTADKRLRKKRGRVVADQVVVRPRTLPPTKRHWSVGFLQRATERGAVAPRPVARRTASCSYDSIEARKEADFQYWWRESRNQSLRPRDAQAPSAKERLDALRARVAARVVA